MALQAYQRWGRKISAGPFRRRDHDFKKIVFQTRRRSLPEIPPLLEPAEIVSSNHYAVLDREACSGCETCVDRCQTNALAMDDDGLAVLNPDRCIGCGLCVITCPEEALHLQAKAPEEQYQLPEDGMDQMMTLAQKRGVL